MKKREFTELIRKSLVVDVNPALVEKYISMAYDLYVVNHWQNKRTQNIDFYSKLFPEQDILGTGSERYIMLPAAIIDLPIAGGGVSVEPVGEISARFLPVTLNQTKILKELEVGLMPGQIWYLVTQDRIQLLNKIYGFSKVNLRLVIRYDSYLPSDEIYFAPHSQMSIRDIVWQFLRQSPVEDKVIDSNQKTT
jgi:hypothetical protein